MPVSTQDFVAGFDATGRDTIDQAQVNQLVDLATPYSDKGLVVTTTDTGAGPDVPVTTGAGARLKTYIWRRKLSDGSIYLYIWDESIADEDDDDTYAKWRRFDIISSSGGLIQTADIDDGAVTDIKIDTVGWDKITAVPELGITPGSDVSGKIEGVLTINPGVVTGAKIAALTIQEGNIADGAITVSKLSGSIVASAMPAGSVIAFAGIEAPDGWHECDGSGLPIADYPNLVAAIFTTSTTPSSAEDDGKPTYGYRCNSSGSYDAGGTCVRLPDLRGYFIRGWTNGSAVKDSGRGPRSVQSNKNLAHTHANTVSDTFAVTAGNIVSGSASGSFQISGGGSKAVNANAITGAVSITNVSSGETDGRPVNIAMMYIIKT